jgi:hypothetical protein
MRRSAASSLVVLAVLAGTQRLAPNPLSQVAIRGTATAGVATHATTSHGIFRGRFEIDSFTLGGSGLAAVGTLRGTLNDTRYPGPQPIVVTDWQLQVTPATVNPADCTQLDLGFAGRRTRFLSLATTIPPRTIRIRPGPARSSRLTRELACAANAELADSGGGVTNTLVHVLDALAAAPPEIRS